MMFSSEEVVDFISRGIFIVQSFNKTTMEKLIGKQISDDEWIDFLEVSYGLRPPSWTERMTEDVNETVGTWFEANFGGEE